MNLKFLKSFTVIIISKKFTGEIFFTGAPAVHRWCGEILKYRTLVATPNAAWIFTGAENKAMGKKSSCNSKKKWRREKILDAWGIQTGPFAAF